MFSLEMKVVIWMNDRILYELVKRSFEDCWRRYFCDLEDIEITFDDLMKGGGSDGCENDDEI